MTIALLSDLHDHWDTWDAISAQLKALGITRLLFLGDTCAPVMLEHMAETFAGTIDHVFGNVDGDQFTTAEKMKSFPDVTLHGREAVIEIDGKKIFMVHYPIYAEHAAAAGKYDYVFFGHSHKKSANTVGKTKLVNPGTAGGVKYPATFATIDLQTGETTFYDVKG